MQCVREFYIVCVLHYLRNFTVKVIVMRPCLFKYKRIEVGDLLLVLMEGGVSRQGTGRSQ